MENSFHPKGTYTNEQIEEAMRIVRTEGSKKIQALYTVQQEDVMFLLQALEGRLHTLLRQSEEGCKCLYRAARAGSRWCPRCGQGTLWLNTMPSYVEACNNALRKAVQAYNLRPKTNSLLEGITS